MSITDTPTVTRTLDVIVADLRDIKEHAAQAVQDAAAVRADADDKIRGLEATCKTLLDERDQARQTGLDLQRENSALVAAAFVLAADGIRREEELQAALATTDTALRKARAENASQLRVNLALQGALDDAGRDGIRQIERIAFLDAENQQLRTELAGVEALRRAVGESRAKRGRFRHDR